MDLAKRVVESYRPIPRGKHCSETLGKRSTGTRIVLNLREKERYFAGRGIRTTLKTLKVQTGCRGPAAEGETELRCF